MIESVSALPPIVIADLFGVATSTAQRWGQYALDSWADLAATQALALSAEHAPTRGPTAVEECPDRTQRRRQSRVRGRTPTLNG